jgi:hypothetical protein
VEVGHPGTRSSALNGAALAAVGLGSVIQVALYLRSFGATHLTDGIIAAISVYTLATAIAQLLRTSAVPLLVGDRPTVSEPEFLWTVILISTAVTIACFAAASPLGNTVAGSSTAAGIRVATTAIRIMSPAIGLQIAAAGLAVVGATRGRLNLVALAYGTSGLLGLVGYVVLAGPTGIQVLAWTNLISGLATVVVLVPELGAAHSQRPSLRALRATAAVVFRGVPVPASFILMYPLTLALAPTTMAGDITLFGLAYTTCAYLSGLTAQALSMADVVMLSQLTDTKPEASTGIVTRAFRYSLLLAAPGAAAAAVVGGPLLATLMPARVGASANEFSTYIVLLGPLLLGTLSVWALLPAILSTPATLWRRHAVAAATGLIIVHLAATVTGRVVWGFDGVVVAMAVAPAAFVVTATRLAMSGAATRLLRTAGTICAVSLLSFGFATLLMHVVLHGSDLVARLVAAGVGTAIYAAIISRTYPNEALTLCRLLVP